MDKKNVAIETIVKDNVCMDCLKVDKDIFRFFIDALGYGSSFDTFSTRIQLCNECLAKYPNVWSNEVIQEEYCEFYKYEDVWQDIVEGFPLAGQELFWNRLSSSGYCTMEPQDWILYQQNKLPHDKCKEYGLYSHDEKLAYRERFADCDNVFIVQYSDGSAGARCPHGAFGNKDGTPYKYNISTECYNCTRYVKNSNRELPTVYSD